MLDRSLRPMVGWPWAAKGYGSAVARAPKYWYFMSDEAATGSAGTLDGGGYSPRSRGEPAQLQSRAHFLQNWNWASVTQIHDGLCQRGRAQRGINPETHEAVDQEWGKRRASELSLLETFQYSTSNTINPFQNQSFLSSELSRWSALIRIQIG